MDGFDSVVYNILGEEGLLGLDFYKFSFMNTMKELIEGDTVHVDRVDGKYPVWYSLVTDEYSSAELLQYYFDNCKYVEEDPLTPEECDFLLREMYSDYEIPNEKLRILIDHGVVSSGKKTEYGEPDPEYTVEYSGFLNCDCTDKNAPNALYYAIVGKYPVSTLKMLHEEANVPYDVDCKGVPFIVHAMEEGCSDDVIRYLAEIADWDFSDFSFEDSDNPNSLFGVDVKKPDYSSIHFAGGKDGFGQDINDYIDKYEKWDVWEDLVDEWADAYVDAAMEAYEEGRK